MRAVPVTHTGDQNISNRNIFSNNFLCSWCALSTDSYGNYITWAYCGYGNSNEDNCVYPFVYGGVEYSTCVDSWCATSAYENTKEYYSYKSCTADELALGLTTFDYGAGTTITGEECVPMIYSGANYLNCNSDTGTGGIRIISHSMIKRSPHKNNSKKRRQNSYNFCYKES